MDKLLDIRAFQDAVGLDLRQAAPELLDDRSGGGIGEIRHLDLRIGFRSEFVWFEEQEKGPEPLPHERDVQLNLLDEAFSRSADGGFLLKLRYAAEISFNHAIAEIKAP